MKHVYKPITDVNPCDVYLQGYERIDGGTPRPVRCSRAINHDGLHADQFNGNPIEWPQNKSERPHGVIDVQYGNDPKPFRKIIKSDPKTDGSTLRRAAPELLKSAKNLLGWLREFYPNEPLLSTETAQQNGAVRALEAAIAKAEGR
jgi:hypothetical protein